MISFIICEDNLTHQNNIKKIINKVLMPSNIEYKIECFNDFNEKIINKIKDPGIKVYIIDIELPSGSGVDLVSEIRANGDWDSHIIIQSIHYQMAYDLYKKKLLIFDFINKLNKFEQELATDINKIISINGTKQFLSFKNDGIFYRIKLKDIIKLEYISSKRKTLITSVNNVYEVSNNLSKLKSQLGGNFLEVYRGIIINKDHIVKMDLINDYLHLSKNVLIDKISRNQKRVLRELYE